MKRVGLLTGRDWSWPPKFVQLVASRAVGVTVETVRLDILPAGAELPYEVVIDRVSHRVPFYRSWLKAAAAQGVVVINNPFLASAVDAFTVASLADRLGLVQPRTVVLPNHSHAPGVDAADLANLAFPLDWEAILETVGVPAVVKDARQGGSPVQRVDSVEELIRVYDQSGQRTLIIQELVVWDHYVQCMCIGQDRILPMRYDPKERRAHLDHGHLSDDLGATIVDGCQRINRALGLDINAVEFAVRDGVPYAIKVWNPVPDMDYFTLSPHYFDWTVSALADLAIERTLAPRRQALPRWDTLLAGELAPLGASAADVDAL